MDKRKEAGTGRPMEEKGDGEIGGGKFGNGEGGGRRLQTCGRSWAIGGKRMNSLTWSR